MNLACFLPLGADSSGTGGPGTIHAKVPPWEDERSEMPKVWSTLTASKA